MSDKLTKKQLARRQREAAGVKSTLNFSREGLGLKDYSYSYLARQVTYLMGKLDANERELFKEQAKRLNMTRRDMADYLILRKRSEQTRVEVEDAILSQQMPALESSKRAIIARRIAKIEKAAGVVPSPLSKVNRIIGVPKLQKIDEMKWAKNKEDLSKMINEELLPAQHGLEGWKKHVADDIRAHTKKQMQELDVKSPLADFIVNQATDEQVLSMEQRGFIRKVLYNDGLQAFQSDDDEFNPFSLPENLTSDEMTNDALDEMDKHFKENLDLQLQAFEKFSVEPEEAEATDNITDLMLTHGATLDELHDMWIEEKNKWLAENDSVYRYVKSESGHWYKKRINK